LSEFNYIVINVLFLLLFFLTEEGIQNKVMLSHTICVIVEEYRTNAENFSVAFLNKMPSLH
jgi:hypothetical protein